MTIEDARKMVGTEFYYICPPAGKVKAYVKAFDPKIGLTCVTLETATSEGRRPKRWEAKVEEDGTWCVAAFDFQLSPSSLYRALADLAEIAETGALDPVSRADFNEGAGLPPSCAFK